MERIPAACAMEWSIELDKGLRSKHSDLRKLALERIGPRLQQLSLEPNFTKSIADIYDLVPGEDRSFTNTIVLRLCNAFETGDSQTRRQVLRIFLRELKQLKEKNKGYKGILSKERLSNPSEILNKLKSMFHSGNFEEKVLALQMLGCMADVAKDSFEIRSLVLSSLDSSDDREVIAAVFASSCFSLLAEDFACIFLRLLPNIITSLRTSSAVVLMAVRALSKIRCTVNVASRAYKVGRSLFMDLLEEGLKPEMLSSLTILASKFCILSSQQFNFLLEILRQESAPLVKERIVNCLYYLISKDASYFTASIDDLAALLLVTEDVNLALKYQYRALRILHKVINKVCQYFSVLSQISAVQTLEKFLLPSQLVCNSIADGTLLEAPDLLKLMQVLGKISHASERGKQNLSLHVLVEIACNYRNEIAKGNENDLAMLNNFVTKVVFDQINSVVEKLSDKSKELTEMDSSDFRSLLGFSLQITKNNPSAGFFALEKVLSLSDVLKKGTTNTGRNLLSSLFRFLNISLSKILENGGVNPGLYPKLKTLVESIKENSYERFCLSMNLFKAKHDHGFEPANSKLRICTEIKALKLVKKIIEGHNYWDAYKIGIYSCCEGLWFCSDFIFKELVGVLKSDMYNSWFKFLLLFSASETEIRLLLFPKPGLRLVQELNKEIGSCEDDIVSCDDMDNDYENVNLSVNLCSLEGKLYRVFEMLHSVDQILVSNSELFFQRWFVSLRMRFLDSVIELIRIINRSDLGNEKLKVFLHDLFNCTTKLTQLAKEYDLICLSYLEIESDSFGVISALALVCSLLAFCTGILLAFLPQEDGTRFSVTPVLEDLFGRLDGCTTEITPHWKKLLSPESELIGLLGVFQLGIDTGHFGIFSRECRSLCGFALSGLDKLRDNCAKESVKDSERLTFLNKGVEFLSEVLLKCIGLNLRLPKCFFRIRPSIGAELFMFNSGLQNESLMSISHGSHLSLNICIQLKNVAHHILSSIKELHCIVSVSSSHTFSSRSPINFDPSVAKEMVELNIKLLQYVKNVSRGVESADIVEAEVGLVQSYVSFEMNKGGQGFGTCLLDVSNFNEGLYQIKWHSGFVDEKGVYWSLLPLNAGVVFNVKKTECKFT